MLHGPQLQRCSQDLFHCTKKYYQCMLPMKRNLYPHKNKTSSCESFNECESFNLASSRIKTHGSESRGQGGSSQQSPDELETHTCEYFTGTRVVKIKNAITKEP